MKVLAIFFGTIFGIIAFFLILAFIIWVKIKMIARKAGFDKFNLQYLIDDLKKGVNDIKYNPKHISGMTNLLRPLIERDFPTFNESELFNKTETGLRTIFNSLEDKKVDKSLPLLKEQLKQIIDDYISCDINVKYDEVKFHAFSIKKYNKKDGVATIQVQCSLEYYYKKEKKGKVIENYSNYKKQTRYTVEFIYVYDVTQVKEYTKVIGVHCPNCGAPLKSLGHKVCDYCHTGLEDLNLKNWLMSSYKEDD
ncbi:MAG: zinc ribbon domain-containing protein [Bacilli bacterium]|nr:zinc ribbon domain-containing protein [Bacilli bacterium]